MEQLLTYKQTALMLGLNELTVMRLVKRGEIPLVKINTSSRLRYSDVVAFIERKTTVAGPYPYLPESADSAGHNPSDEQVA